MRLITMALAAYALAFAPAVMAQQAPAAQPPAAAPATPAPAPPMFTVEQLRPLYARTGSPCAIQDARQFNINDTRAFYELVCEGGYGEVAIITLPVTPTSAIGWSNCTLAASATFNCNMTTAEANRAWLDQRLAALSQTATNGGQQCQATRFQYFPPRNATEPRAMELACSNRPESVVIVSAPSGEVAMGCARAWAEGFRCSLSDKATWITAANTDLKAVESDTACQVSDVQAFGGTASDVYLEVACADGGRGFLLQYPRGSVRPSRATNCVLATQIGGGCRMPTNLSTGPVPIPGR